MARVDAGQARKSQARQENATVYGLVDGGGPDPCALRQDCGDARLEPCVWLWDCDKYARYV